MPKVFLTAGHGGTDPGAVAYGMKEKNINLDILLSCKSELERHGVVVVCSRTKDENDPVAQEVREANASGADLAVSYHTNSSSSGKGDGSESYYYPGNKDGKKLAELCEKHTKAIGQNSRGVKSGKSLYFVKNTTMTAVLCECAFINNDTDNDIIDTVAEVKKFGVAYAKAILEYFGITYKAETTSKKDNSFKVRVSINNLNIRVGAGTNFVKRCTIAPGVYTITEVKQGRGSTKGWGKLKSGLGWISLDYVENA